MSTTPMPTVLRCGDDCPCGGHVHSSASDGDGKQEWTCDRCGRHTVGHNLRRERGPQPPPMRRVTNRYQLRRIYGRSYFGSGGARGSVQCCDNCEPIDWQDNGFVAGPAAVRVKNWRKPASFTAHGGDCIGEGRSWSEAATWNPQTRQWEVVR